MKSTSAWVLASERVRASVLYGTIPKTGISALSASQNIRGVKQPTVNIPTMVDGAHVRHLLMAEEGCAYYLRSPNTVLRVVSSSSAMLSTVRTAP